MPRYYLPFIALLISISTLGCSGPIKNGGAPIYPRVYIPDFTVAENSNINPDIGHSLGYWTRIRSLENGLFSSITTNEKSITDETLILKGEILETKRATGNAPALATVAGAGGAHYIKAHIVLSRYATGEIIFEGDITGRSPRAFLREENEAYRNLAEQIALRLRSIASN